MKQTIPLDDFLALPIKVQWFFYKWQEINNLPITPCLSLQELINLYVILANAREKEDSDGRTFNFSIKGHNFSVQYDGDEAEGLELIDAVFYEVAELLKRRIAVMPVVT